MVRFKEIEPTLKKCFNIDRNTTVMQKCISESINSAELTKTKIPDTYIEDGDPDILAYAMDFAESIIIPINETFDFKEFTAFCQSNNIEDNTLLFDSLVFMFLFNETSNKKYYTGSDEAEQDFLQYALGVRPELLKLYIALQENNNNEPITIRLGSSKPIKVDNDITWLREELERYLHTYLGVADLTEAKLEYFTNYDPKEGAPNDRKLNRYIWGIYNLLEETGTIKAKTEKTVSRKQAKFIEDFLMAIHLIDMESNLDENNIRSRLNYLIKKHGSIEKFTKDLDYKRSPNNEGGTRLY